MTLDGVVRSVDLPAGPDQVWRAITDASIMTEWFGGRVVFDARPGGSISLEQHGEVRRGAVDTFVEHQRISFIWYVDEDEPTEVILEIEPHRDHTTLRVTERTFVWEFDSADPAWTEGRGQPWLPAGVR
ncbi:MAG TPA: hypothetical protein ENH15_06375 [Actinobacteria bacterium]|nr:hypothetical protein [Actinomycetota bacterium]